VDDRITVAIDDVDDQTALMSMPAGDRTDLMREDDPVLQRRVFDHEAEVVAQPALAREVLRAIGELADDAAGHLPLSAFPVLLYRQLVGALLGCFLFTDAGALEFGHGPQPSQNEVQSTNGVS